MALTKHRNLSADAVLLLAALIWGATFTVVKQALDYTSPFMFMTMRFALALAVITLVTGHRLGGLTRREWVGGLLTGAALFLGFAMQTWGLVYTSASKSAFITGLSVVLVPFMLWGLGQQHLRARRWIAAALATVGLLLLIDPSGQAGINRGDLLTLGCAVAFAGQIIFLGIYAPTTDTLRYFWVQLATVVVLAGLATTVVQGWYVTPGAPLWFGLGITGIGGTALAFLGMTWAQRYTSPARAALILTSEPVFGAAFAVLLAGETLAAAAWLGGALIVGVILWSEWQPPAVSIRNRG